MLILSNNQISCFLTLSSVVDVLMRTKGFFYCVRALEFKKNQSSFPSGFGKFLVKKFNLVANIFQLKTKFLVPKI